MQFYCLLLVLIMLLCCDQDTVIAMKALSGFAQDTFTKELAKRVTFDLPSLLADPVSITPDNRYQRNTVNVSIVCVTDYTNQYTRILLYQVPSVPSNGNCVSWTGSGTAIIQVF